VSICFSMHFVALFVAALCLVCVLFVSHFGISIRVADNGTISPVIQTTNGSRVLSSRPRTDVRPNGKDTRSNAEHKVERKR